MPKSRDPKKILLNFALGKSKPRTASGRKPPKRNRSMQDKLKPRFSVGLNADRVMLQVKKRLR